MGGGEVQFFSLTSALDGDEWSPWHFGRFNPKNHGPRAVLGVLEKRKSLGPIRISIPGPSSPQLFAISPELRRLLLKFLSEVKSLPLPVPESRII